MNKTGYDIELKIKEFDNGLILPNNYYNTDENKDNLERFTNKVDEMMLDPEIIKLIDEAISVKGTDFSLAYLSHKIFEDWIYYDPDVEKWYNHDNFNVWGETDLNHFKLMNQSIIISLFNKRIPHFHLIIQEKTERKKVLDEDIKIITTKRKELEKATKKSQVKKTQLLTLDLDGAITDIQTTPSNDTDENENKLLEELKKINLEIGYYKAIIDYTRLVIVKIQKFSNVSSVISNAGAIFSKKGFYEKYLDTNPHLFSFINKVYDFNTKETRPISPDDYIMKTTGYKYPDEGDIKQQDKDYIIAYFKLLFPDEEMYKYIMDICCYTLNGVKKDQFFVVHTGSGSNGKSTFDGLFKKVLGDYAVNISHETFTKPKKGVNDTGELYLTKGARGVFTNEPPDSDKLQTSTLKECADACNRSIKSRALYCNVIEFLITFTIHFCCNNKPALSTCDDGVGRRVKVIDWDRKFVDKVNYDEKNPNHILKDNSFILTITQDKYRDAFMLILLDWWSNRLFELKSIPVPEKVDIASSSYLADSNEVLGYITDYYDYTNDLTEGILSSTLYTDFCSKYREVKITRSKFKNDLIATKRITFKHTKKGNEFFGIKLKETDDDEDE